MVPVVWRRVGIAVVLARGHVRRGSAVEALLGGQDLLELTVVEKDPLAVLALLEVHTLPIDGAQLALAFGTDHGREYTASPACCPGVVRPHGTAGWGPCCS